MPKFEVGDIVTVLADENGDEFVILSVYERVRHKTPIYWALRANSDFEFPLSFPEQLLQKVKR